MGGLRVVLAVAALAHVATSLNILVNLLGTSQPERATMEHIAQQLALRYENTVHIIRLPDNS